MELVTKREVTIKPVAPLSGPYSGTKSWGYRGSQKEDKVGSRPNFGGF